VLVSFIVAGLAIVSLVLNLWQWVAGRRFALHRRVSQSSFAPGVTLLKPLKGCDSRTEECLRSWLEQQYCGPKQVLFGVASARDPVGALVRRLIAEHPAANAALVIVEKELGPNAKVSTLVHLFDRAAHELIVVSDADVWAPPDLLSQLVLPFQASQAGLVNCFYQMPSAPTVAMQLEAMSINADFWSQVLQAQTIRPVDFALGAVMATTRDQLERVGGFAALLEYLADDYQLGHQIRRSGGSVTFCPVVVECRSAPARWREVWNHQLRWTRTIRVCKPLPFFLSILSNGTAWPLLWVIIDGTAVSLAGATAMWCARVLTAWANQRRLTGRGFRPWHAWQPLAKDLLAVALWGLAFAGNEIQWRGRRFRIDPDGRLTAADRP
jgi:ceramide glucosyltransferase